MINNLLKDDLNQLKVIVARETNTNYIPSYNDIIIFLINYYKKLKRIEFPLEKKLFVEVPLKPISSINVSSKLENKTRIAFFLEN